MGLKPDGRLSAFERLFDRPMGLFAMQERLYMSSKYQMWRFENALGNGELYNGYDALYVPRVAHTTGDLDIHDVAVDNDQGVVFINTLHSCLAGVSGRYSFIPLWKPPFISRLAPEDRCHLNGLAMADGSPRYVTAVSRSDVVAGWRERRASGGCVIDVTTDEIILTGLSMPHSPRFYRGRLWLHNSGAGEFGYVDLERGAFEPVAFCPGYLRGLAFHGGFAIAGLSGPRHNRTFSGLALDDRLAEKDAESRCGIMVIDLESGNIAHWLQIEGIITELYDVQVLPGVRCPMSLGLKTDEIRRLITVPPHDGQGRKIHGGLSMTPLDSRAPASSTASTPPGPEYRFQTLEDIAAAAVINYEAYTFPSIKKRWQTRPPEGPLVAVAATSRGRLDGAILAEERPGGAGAEVISLFVAPDCRRRGIGANLMASLDQDLARRGCKMLDLSYRSDWRGLEAIERLLKKSGWSAPQVPRLVCRTSTEKIAGAPWLRKYRLPDAYAVFPWVELTSEEKSDIKGRQEEEQWYPPVLTPFQEEERLEPANSLGLRYQGRIVGWMITHRTAPDTIQYTSLFVEKGLQRMGRAISLLAGSIIRQIERDVPYGIFMIDAENESMLRFARRRLGPYLISMAESRYSQKDLGLGH